MEKTNCRGIFIAILVLATTNSFATQYTLNLTVRVEGARASTGQAIATLFSSADRYLKEPDYRQILPINDHGRVQFIFKGLKEGTYAISIVYDENSNGELDTGFFGIPSELVGFSNNAKGTFGPPSFERASFIFSETGTISIVLGQAKE